MRFFPYLAAFLLLRNIRNDYKLNPAFAKWDNLFKVFMGGIVIIYFFTGRFIPYGVSDLLAGVVLLGLIKYLDSEPDFSEMRPVLKTSLPLCFVSILTGLVKLILPKYAEEWQNYFALVEVGTFMWIFGRAAVWRKQKKEVEQVNEKNSELEKLVAERTYELTRQKDELQNTVQELKATQAQLIQQEKLASLGELTAGIAHEIQNPLNFVNNFSEVSAELLDDMQEELNRGETEEVVAIIADLKQNLEKIQHHGRRADGIVKGMLQHSRTSTGQKEPADINALADEYMRLAYHGLRAKNKMFNADLVMHLDPALPKPSVIGQDIGRVLLNLFTNAFYAVSQKQKTAGPDYKPVVTLTTRALVVMPGTRAVEIRVKDNGTGIPEVVKDKIMQPFFTTKPAGEGTGLGLSLSYDIVVQVHGGKIDINTVENEYTEFVVTLPA